MKPSPLGYLALVAGIALCGCQSGHAYLSTPAKTPEEVKQEIRATLAEMREASKDTIFKAEK